MNTYCLIFHNIIIATQFKAREELGLHIWPLQNRTKSGKASRFPNKQYGPS